MVDNPLALCAVAGRASADANNAAIANESENEDSDVVSSRGRRRPGKAEQFMKRLVKQGAHIVATAQDGRSATR
ncbi:hypothetical protein [Rhodopseudomonas sp. B29]|uniref:hypothetical protein n=1 Tax=Rhodopseudomonas sp. B29 TaxID=95607 RepID=UPI0003B6046F|nr:hypothetical protein [Rhodopseudomonas sp. B29]